jgi:hypothetical protein
MWKSRAIERGFSKQLWESASRKCRRRPPIDLRISIAAAFSTGCSFFFFGSFFFFDEFSLWKNRPGRVTNMRTYRVNDWRRFSNAISTGSWTYAQMMSFEDSAIRVMGNSLPDKV